MPYRKVGKNKYRRKGRTYSLKQITAIHFNKLRRRRAKKRT